ncbi:hypothetical protein TNCV_3907141 [Trichonephila clavipes]|nr:hypothetical protein TNCV_3907141 [Trichonephila clavipes]
MPTVPSSVYASLGPEVHEQIFRSVGQSEAELPVLSSQFCAAVRNPAIMTSVNRLETDGIKKEVPCPKAAVVYNDVMGGDDHFDQRKEIY